MEKNKKIGFYEGESPKAFQCPVESISQGENRRLEGKLAALPAGDGFGDIER
ncbi:MAG: hypothetical protein AB1611_04940 [bacterium]